MPEFTLMAHQKRGVKFLDDHDGIAALLWEPGVGKTGATLAWVDKQAKAKTIAEDDEFRVLVVAPLTAADTWVLQPPLFMDSAVKARMLQGSTKQILATLSKANDWVNLAPAKIGVNHGGDLSKSRGRVTILSMSAGAVSSFCKQRPQTVQMLRAVKKFKPDLIVVDESQIIKAHNSNVSKAMYQLGQLAPHRIILTGTVNPHSPLDCYGQWRFLAPWTFSDQYGERFTKRPTRMTVAEQRSIRPWPWGRFRDRYAKMGGFEGKGIVGMNEASVGELHARVAERSMVVLKKDALDLPPTQDIDVHVTLSPTEQRIYDEMKTDLAAALADGTLLEAPNALAKIMKLRQIHAGFVRDTENNVTHEVGDSLRKAVSEIVNVTLDGENRIVVFAYFKSECAALAKSLAKKGRTVEVITGQTKPSERLAIRQRFKDVKGNPEQTVLVAQARTMSLSVNELITAQHAIYASMSERRDDWVQSRGRLDRNGQTLPVTFWNCYVPGAIGQIMLDTHKRRGDMEKALIDYIRSAR